MRLFKSVSLVVLALFVLACSSSSANLGDDLKLNEDPDSILLSVTSAGGFVPVEFMVNQGPHLVLTRGGQLIHQGPQIEIYPGPLLANWQMSQLDEESMLFVLEELDALNFDEIGQVENNDATGVADAPITTVRFYNQDGEHSFAVYALGITEDSTDDRVPILANLVDRLGTMTGTSSTSYAPEMIQVVAGIGAGEIDESVANVREWPLPVPYDEMSEIGFEWRCAAYDGEDAQNLLEVFAEANQATRWTLGDSEYQILVRPLFPNERPCEPLG
ncbi:MAG TPA: hypothetical protein VJ815_09025 [Acidimicrobiia bacterium]|nr:hypothetical protein [Acidimicrobiia bacterium]